jgi:hypothetical protein
MGGGFRPLPAPDLEKVIFSLLKPFGMVLDEGFRFI